MPDLDLLLSVGNVIDEGHRAALAWRRISDKPTSVTIKRGATALSAQTVRVEHSESATRRDGNAGETAVRAVIVFGVLNHPDVTVLDTDIQRKDRFILNNTEYQVVDVVITLGEVQARCEVVG